jgi:hypothetical protein
MAKVDRRGIIGAASLRPCELSAAESYTWRVHPQEARVASRVVLVQELAFAVKLKRPPA